MQPLVLRCFHASLVEQEPGCIGSLAHGVLRVAGAGPGRVPVPFETTESVELELVFANGAMCRVTGRGLTLKSAGEAPIAEWLKC
ncbi:hypothetical protein GCM10007350_24260 [Jeongeupia chitinilytica]|uniref:Diaminopimelate epimerase n=2 Tax=Jeongeupia chitinilytica TaxID=1041641 RepID=A0ABQ3H2L8_9NEIS|nr:hypothetical protein GCM10007350_24260 [Jeongeupia chitinilytica]